MLAIANLEESTTTTVLALSLPLLAAGTTCAAGRLSESPGSCTGAFLGSGAAALASLALVGSGYLVGEPGWGDDLAAGLYLGGVFSYLLTPPVTSIVGYREWNRPEAIPLRITTPDGEALGVQLRFGL